MDDIRSPLWLPLCTRLFIACFSLVTCYVCVPRVSPQMCVLAWKCFSASSQCKERDERWWWCEERAAAASFTALFIPLQSHRLVSASSSRRNVECVGELDLQLTLVVRKRMLALTRCLWITEWNSLSLLYTPPPRRTFFWGGQNTRKLKAKGCIEWKVNKTGELRILGPVKRILLLWFLVS